MRVGERIAEALRAAREAVRAAELARAGIDPDLIDVPELRPQSLGALVLGLSAREIATLAPQIRAAGMPGDAFTVILTDRCEIEVFQVDGFVTEYLAPQAALSAVAPGSNPELYARRRLGLICAKWNLRRVLHFGEVSMRLAEIAKPAGSGMRSDLFVACESPLSIQK